MNMMKHGDSYCSTRMRDVYQKNFSTEATRFLRLLSTDRINTISMDTEFPGFLFNPTASSTEQSRYEILKKNVESTKLLQVGFTLCHDEKVIGTWQFNLSGFNPNRDRHNPDSIRMLESSGIDFKRNKRHGVHIRNFVKLLWEIWRQCERGMFTVQWVVFHGLYDFAYLLSVALKFSPLRHQSSMMLPEDPEGFARLVSMMFGGSIMDVKFMLPSNCQWMGLEKLAQTLKVARVGNSHQAGSDSLLTAGVYFKMFAQLKLEKMEFDMVYEGWLFGFNVRVSRSLETVDHMGFGEEGTAPMGFDGIWYCSNYPGREEGTAPVKFDEIWYYPLVSLHRNIVISPIQFPFY